jgi:hypothetical protein
MIGVIFFHKNIEKIYRKEWIDKCIDSILNQTYNGKVSYYEIDYSGRNNQLVPNSIFYNLELNNHAEAMNFIIDRAFNDGCEYVFNTNMDDYYHLDRIKLQMYEFEKGFDIVSSDFKYIDENDNLMFKMDILNYPITKHFGDEINSLLFNHNTVAHPCVAFNKKFWETNKYNPDEIPVEDLNLWKRAIKNNFKIKIMPDVLLFYRRHESQITKN